MAYYNHFTEQEYPTILFSSLKIGEKFRNDLFRNGRRSKNIICIKTGDLTYQEQKSKKVHTLLDAERVQVNAFINQTNPK